jgi:thiol-disulfide isomerase/thioredoxin
MQIRQVFVLGLLGIGLAGCQQRSASPVPQQAAPQQTASIATGEIGSQLPEFSIKDLRGREINSADLRGKVVLIDFWATWCGPCKKEMPGYQQLLNRYGDRGFVVIGLKFDTMRDTQDPIKFAKRLHVLYPLAVATDEVRQKFGGIEGLPTTLIYDRNGILRQKVIGFEYTATFEDYLKQVL